MRAANTEQSYLIDGVYGIRDLVDIPMLKETFQKLTDATGFSIELSDFPEMNILISTGRQEICTRYHRATPDAVVSCIRINSNLVSNREGPIKAVVLECKYGLMDCGVPVVVDGIRIASLFTGQIFQEEPDLDRFSRQAEAFGFGMDGYIDALKKVPVISRDGIAKIAEFLAEIARMVSEMGYRNLQKLEKTNGLEEEINQRKIAEDCLRQSEEKYRFLAEKMADIVWTVDLDLKNTYVTPSVQGVLGFTPEERNRQTLEEKITPESLARVKKCIVEELKRDRKHADERQRFVVMEVEYYHKNGSTVWLENTMKAIRNQSGEITGIYGVSRDISQRRTAEKEKKILQDQLAAAQKMESLGRLAGGVAHDFNNLLTVILGHTELGLQALSPSDELHSTLLQIHHAAEDSAALTRQLLAFARKQVIRPRLLNINEAVAGLLKMLRRLIGEQIELNWIPDDDLWLSMIDPSQIDQVLINLCVNARDAISGVGSITIKTENAPIDAEFCTGHRGITPGDFLKLTVADSGCGMDDDVRRHLFEPFFTTKGVGHGTGLGLATVYGIVKQNKGYVSVCSELNQGTSVSIYLPRSETGEIGTPEISTSKIPKGKGETVLLVEDEKAVLKMTVTMLEGLGYTVIPAGLPEEALEIVRNYPGEIHLLLTDLVMPQMNGRELVEKVEEIKPSMKCLFMSGYTADIVIIQDVTEKGLLFIQKPFSMQTLAERVHKALTNA
jgi:PAS domain S-box-containing protein